MREWEIYSGITGSKDFNLSLENLVSYVHLLQMEKFTVS